MKNGPTSIAKSDAGQGPLRGALASVGRGVFVVGDRLGRHTVPADDAEPWLGIGAQALRFVLDGFTEQLRERDAALPRLVLQNREVIVFGGDGRASYGDASDASPLRGVRGAIGVPSPITSGLQESRSVERLSGFPPARPKGQRPAL